LRSRSSSSTEMSAALTGVSSFRVISVHLHPASDGVDHVVVITARCFRGELFNLLVSHAMTLQGASSLADHKERVAVFSGQLHFHVGVFRFSHFVSPASQLFSSIHVRYVNPSSVRSMSESHTISSCASCSKNPHVFSVNTLDRSCLSTALTAAVALLNGYAVTDLPSVYSSNTHAVNPVRESVVW